MSYKTLNNINNINNFSNNEDGGSTGKLQYYQACTNDNKPSAYTSSKLPGWPGGYVNAEKDNLNGLFCIGVGGHDHRAITDVGAPPGTKYSDYTKALDNLAAERPDFFCGNDGTGPGCYLGFKCTPESRPGVKGGVDLWPKTLQELKDYDPVGGKLCLIADASTAPGVDKVRSAYNQCVNSTCVITHPPHTPYPVGDARIPRCAVSGPGRGFAGGAGWPWADVDPGVWSGEGASCTKHRQPETGLIACHCGKNNRQWMCARSHPEVPLSWRDNTSEPNPGTTPLFGQNTASPYGNNYCATAQEKGGDIGTNWDKFYSNPPGGVAITEKTCEGDNVQNKMGMYWCARKGEHKFISNMGGGWGGKWVSQPASTPYGPWGGGPNDEPAAWNCAGPFLGGNTPAAKGMWCPGGACSKVDDPTLYPSKRTDPTHMWPPTLPYPACGPSVKPGSS